MALGVSQTPNCILLKMVLQLKIVAKSSPNMNNNIPLPPRFYISTVQIN